MQKYIPTEYRFARLSGLTPNILGMFMVAKFEDLDEAPSAVYFVTVKDDVVECTCPAYTMPVHKPVACKHAVMVARWWLIKESKRRARRQR